jgi:hypothetical protein
MRTFRRFPSWLALGLGLMAGPATAGVTAYAPFDDLRTDELDTLVTLQDIPVLTRPYPVSLLRDHLAAFAADRPRDGEDLASWLSPLADPFAIHSLRAEGQQASGPAKILPNEHGKTTDAAYDLQGALRLAPWDWSQLMVGGRVYEKADGEARFVPVNTYLSLGGAYLQLDAGYRDHWFGPAADSALLVSRNAPTPPSITLSNPRPTPWGGLRYEVYWARLSKQALTDPDGQVSEGHPQRFGFHLSASPVTGWTVGVSRILQYGGGDRPDGVGDMLQAFVDPSSYDNKGVVGEEFGDQQAAFHSAVNFPGPFPARLYATLAGEDTSRGKNYRLGNAAVTAGLFLPRLTARTSLRYEYSEWKSGWYSHHLYAEGNTNKGVVLGHWFGNERAFNDSVEGMAHSLRLDAELPRAVEAGITARVIDNDTRFTAVDYQTGWELEGQLAWPMGPRRMGTRLYGGQNVFGDDFFSAALWVGWR